MKLLAVASEFQNVVNTRNCINKKFYKLYTRTFKHECIKICQIRPAIITLKLILPFVMQQESQELIEGATAAYEYGRPIGYITMELRNSSSSIFFLIY